MKRNWIYVLMCACAFSCTDRRSAGVLEVTIDYGTVEGYGITVKLFPECRLTDDSCQAIIDLERDGNHRLFLNNAFQDPEQADTLACGTVLKRTYKMPEGADAGQLTLDTFSQMPFFFLDVDFDGEKELVLTLAHQAQRWLNAYQPVHLEYDYMYDCMKAKPFTCLDDTSELDYDRNTITLYAHNGAGSWSSEVYVYKHQDETDVLGPELIMHTQTEYDTWDETNPKKRIITERIDTTGWMPARESVK